MKERNENNQFGEGADNFDLPENYFQKSAGSIFNKIEWQDEHKDFPHLLNFKSSFGFIIPANYFDKSEQTIELLYFPALGSIENKNRFTVPENYFEENESFKLAATVNAENEHLNEFKTLTSLERINTFKVPDNYFEEGGKYISQLVHPKSTKVISLFKRRLSYSIAAMLMIVFGAWIYTVYFNPIPEKDCGTIACLDKTDLVKTKTLERMDDDELYELVDPTVLEEKILNTEVVDSKSENIDTSLKGISVEDLLDGI